MTSSLRSLHKPHKWFLADRRYSLAYDFSGEGLSRQRSPGAVEVALVLPRNEFLPWFDAFLPDRKAATLLGLNRRG